VDLAAPVVRKCVRRFAGGLAERSGGIRGRSRDLPEGDRRRALHKSIVVLEGCNQRIDGSHPVAFKIANCQCRISTHVGIFVVQRLDQVVEDRFS
jgi:hypothetical protein